MLKMYLSSNDFVIAEDKKEATKILCEYFGYKPPLPMREQKLHSMVEYKDLRLTVENWVRRKGKGYLFSYAGCWGKTKKLRYNE